MCVCPVTSLEAEAAPSRSMRVSVIQSGDEGKDKPGPIITGVGERAQGQNLAVPALEDRDARE